jgi:hypothetical protein
VRIEQPIDRRQVEAIANSAGEPLAVRNLWITQAYWELSNRFAQVAGSRDANWCTFATWASFSVGAVIRGETVPRSFLLRNLERVLQDFDDIVQDVSAELSEGNRVVFASIAPHLCDFLDLYAVGQPSASTLERFLAELPESIEPTDSQSLSKLVAYPRAFGFYDAAIRGTNDTMRAEAMLSGNLIIGYNEQLRLQPRITSAFTALPQYLRALIQNSQCGLGRLPLIRVTTHYWLSLVELAWTRYATERLTSLSLPNGRTARPGSDVPTLPNSTGRFPADLAQLHDAQLRELWTYTSRADADGRHSGCDSWIPLVDRMNWIANWFRSRQQTADLFSPPFARDELTRLERGDTSWIQPGGTRT